MSIIIPALPNNPLSNLSYMLVGKGKKMHLSPRNDESLCPATRRGEGRYVAVEDAGDVDLCSSCYKAAEKRYEAEAVTIMPAVWETSGPVLDTVDVMPECYWECGRTIVALWFDYVGRVEGACATHRGMITTPHVTDVPEGFFVAPTAIETIVHHAPLVGIRQAMSGFMGVEHIHAEGCRDINRDVRKYRQTNAELFLYGTTHTLADMVASNWADIASDTYNDEVMTSADAWIDMVEWANDSECGMRLMPCVEGVLGGETPAGTLVRTASGHIDIDAGFQETIAEALGDMVDTVTDTYTIEANLAIEIDGIRISLGWHTFTIENGSEKSIATLYGEAYGDWKRPGKADWSSVIIVVESEIL